MRIELFYSFLKMYQKQWHGLALFMTWAGLSSMPRQIDILLSLDQLPVFCPMFVHIVNIYDIFLMLIFLQASLPQDIFILLVTTTSSLSSSICIASWRTEVQHDQDQRFLMQVHLNFTYCDTTFHFFAALSSFSANDFFQFVFVKVYVGLSLRDTEVAQFRALLSVHEPINWC